MCKSNGKSLFFSLGIYCAVLLETSVLMPLCSFVGKLMTADFAAKAGFTNIFPLKVVFLPTSVLHISPMYLNLGLSLSLISL